MLTARQLGGRDWSRCFRQCTLSLQRDERAIGSRGSALVNGRREGRCVYYRVQPRGMKPLIDWIAHYRAFWTEHGDRLEQLLEKMDQ